MDWFIHNDGCWVAFGHDGQKYEVGEGGGSQMILNICGVRRFGAATTNECKAFADSWDESSQKMKWEKSDDIQA
jgi:hypothetical protein